MNPNRKALITSILITLFFASLAIVNLPVVQAQQSTAPPLDWQKTYAGYEITWISQTSDGGFAMYYPGTLEGGYARYDPAELTKINSAGSIQWIQNFSLPFPKTFITTTDGGFAYLSFDRSPSTIGKLDSNGKSQWNKTFGTAFDGSGMLLQTSDGGFAVAVQNNVGYNQVAILELNLFKTDSNGNLQWTKTYPSLDYYYTFRSFIQTIDGGYALAGSYGDNTAVSSTSSTVSNGTDFCLAKISPDGNLEWTNNYGGADNDNANSIIQTNEGDYVMVGNTLSFGAGGTDGLMVKADAHGNLLWAQTYGGFGTSSRSYFDIFHNQVVYYPIYSNGSSDDYANCLIQTSDEGFAFAGSSDSFIWLVKTDSNGFPQWNQTYPSNPSSEQFHDVKALIQASDGSFVFAGYIEGTHWHWVGNQVSLVFKTKPANAMPTTSSPPISLPALAFEPITINPDGSITPASAPIARDGSTYKLTADVHSRIIVKADNIALDGQGHLINGNGTIGNLFTRIGETAIDLTNTQDVTAQNFKIQNFRYGVDLDRSKNAKISQCSFVFNIIGIEGNHATNSLISQNQVASTRPGYEVAVCLTYSLNDKIDGNQFLNDEITLMNCNGEIMSNNQFENGDISIGGCENTLICGNIFHNCWRAVDLSFYSDSNQTTVAGNNFDSCTGGIWADSEPRNLFYMNNFINVSSPGSIYQYAAPTDASGNPIHLTEGWDNGAVGNFWGNYTNQYPNAQPASDGKTWNTPYVIDAYNRDNHPFINPIPLQELKDLSHQLIANHAPSSISSLKNPLAPASSESSPSSDVTVAAVASLIIIAIALLTVASVKAKRKKNKNAAQTMVDKI